MARTPGVPYPGNMRRAVAAFAVLVVGAAGAVAGVAARGSAFNGGGGVATAMANPVVEVPRAPAPAQEETYLAADALGSQVAIYERPGDGTPMWYLPNPTHENLPLTFFIERREGDRLLARLPMRPNGSRAWIDRSEVALREVPHRIDVDLSDRSLTVLRGDEAVWSTLVAVGAPDTPTPEGRFYVDISLPNPGTPYGAHLLSIAGFSDVQVNFGGGIGQIAAHGWSDPSVVGQAVSNGCLRMPNDAVMHLASMTPTGTPVRIRA